MALSFAMEVLPLQVDAEGAVRIGGTRVTLETIVAAFSDGATAEEIVQQYPSLRLADVYSVIGYYLRRPQEVEAYLQERDVRARTVREEDERRFDPQGIRDRLLARRASSRQ